MPSAEVGEANPLWAHTPAKNSVTWHSLDAHLVDTAKLAREYAAPFGGDAHAYWVGLVHDLGKAHPGFQRYLADSHAKRGATKCPHAAWGAAMTDWAVGGENQAARVSLVLPIDGHHRGLMNWTEAQKDLLHLRKTQAELLQSIASHLPKPVELGPMMHGLKTAAPQGSTDLWTRMVFSALIDADRTDTGRHFQTFHEDKHDSITDLAQRLEREQAKIQAGKTGKLNDARRAIYEACLSSATGDRGFFRLTVPTGGGKTRSAMAFALRHATHHNKRRVIVAIPYTSIIDQNAKVYRDIFGEENVLEHHSQVEETKGQLAQDEDEQGCFHDDGLPIRRRLATERWTHPIVVTTTVQLFESLFTNNPTRARKLHRIANSVIVLDEFQAFPPELLEPTLDVLRDLVKHYHVTVVFCTATQPALETLPENARIHATEIVPDPGHWFSELKRVKFEYDRTPIGWEELATKIAKHEQVLVVLNTRKQARELLEQLQAQATPNLYHLSTLLCGAHRRAILEEIRHRLHTRNPVRLVSTQVVEAGVDVDFPVAYRAVGPLDRIIQVAGRCNREGLLARPGRVVLFQPEKQGSPHGPYRTGLGLAERLLDEYGAEAVEDLGHLQAYFRDLYQTANLDKRGIQELRRDLCFEKVAQEYRLIKQDTVPVVVDYPRKDTTPETCNVCGCHTLTDVVTTSAKSLASKWAGNPTLAGWRALQPYLVNMFRKDADDAKRAGWITPLSDRLGLWTGAYHDLFGIQKGFADPTDLTSH